MINHLICISSLFLGCAYGGTTAWNNGATGNWSDHTNWNSESAPSQNITDSITIASGNVSVSGNLGATPGPTKMQNLTVKGDAHLTIEGSLDFKNDSNRSALSFTIEDSAEVSANHLQLKLNQYSMSILTMSGGTLILRDSNPIRGNSYHDPDQRVNITADAGTFKLVHTNATEPDKALAIKIGADLFAIDGTKIVVTADGSNIDILNQELEDIIVNNKYLQVKTSNNTQTLVVMASSQTATTKPSQTQPRSETKPPSTAALISIGGVSFMLSGSE